MLGKGIRSAFAGLLVVLFPIVLFAGDRVEWTQSGSDFEKGTLIQLEVGHHSPPHLRLVGGMTTLWQETRSLGRDAVAVGVAVDSQDKILVTGYSRQDRDGFHTFKLDASGQTLWKRDYTIGRGGQAAGIAVDPLRNVIVVGSSTLSNPGFYTVKYDPNGVKLWERYYGTPSGEARGVTVDLSSNVIVTGVSVLHDPDFFTVKYDSSGNLLWAKREDIGRSDSARGAAADIQGNIYVVGSVFNSDRQNSDFNLIKYNSQGQLLWKRSYDSGGEDRATNVVADRAGNLVVTGSTKQNGQLADFLTVKFGSDGRLLWARIANGGVDEFAQDVTLDSLGYVIVAGFSKQSSSSSDGFAVKYTPSGDMMWTQRYEHAPQESLNSVAVDSQDKIVFAGYAGSDYKIIKSSDGYASSGEYRSPVQDFGQNVGLTELLAYAVLNGQKITAFVETSNNNFGSVLESARVELQDGVRSYSLDIFHEARYVRVRFQFQTSDPHVSPELHQFSVRGTVKNN